MGALVDGRRSRPEDMFNGLCADARGRKIQRGKTGRNWQEGGNKRGGHGNTMRLRGVGNLDSAEHDSVRANIAQSGDFRHWFLLFLVLRSSTCELCRSILVMTCKTWVRSGLIGDFFVAMELMWSWSGSRRFGTRAIRMSPICTFLDSVLNLRGVRGFGLLHCPFRWRGKSHWSFASHATP